PATSDLSTLSLHDALPIFPNTAETLKSDQWRLGCSGVKFREDNAGGGTNQEASFRTTTQAGKWTMKVVSVVRCEMDRSDGNRVADRKSTRLNSSHSQISYA